MAIMANPQTEFERWIRDQLEEAFAFDASAGRPTKRVPWHLVHVGTCWLVARYGYRNAQPRRVTMAVLSVVTFQVAPARMEDFLAAVRKLHAIEERLAVNLTSMRV